MASHLVIALCLLAAVLVAGTLARHIVRRRADRLVGLVTEGQSAVPTILYFTSENCAPCRLRQTPVLKELGERLEGGFTLRIIDVAEDFETARRYNVLSAPTTVVIDPNGAVRAVNLGVATAEQLHAQIVPLIPPAPFSHSGRRGRLHSWNRLPSPATVDRTKSEGPLGGEGPGVRGYAQD